MPDPVALLAVGGGGLAVPQDARELGPGRERALVGRFAVHDRAQAAHGIGGLLEQLEHELLAAGELGRVQEADAAGGEVADFDAHAVAADAADVIVLLMSEAALATDYIRSVEVTRALERAGRGEVA